MKNYRLSAFAGLLTLIVAGNAFAEDASTNGIPTALLQHYTGATSVVANRSTNAIPTAMLAQYYSFGCPAHSDTADSGQSDTAALTTGSTTSVNDDAVNPNYCK